MLAEVIIKEKKMKEGLISLKREELEEFAIEVVDKANENLDSKLEDFEGKLDDRLDEFKKTLVPEEDKEVSPDTAMGKAIQYYYYKDIRKDDTMIKVLDPQDETTAADGGHLVPDVTRPEIVRLMEEYGQARSSFRQIPMGKAKVLFLPAKLTGATVTRVNENTPIPDTKVTLTRYKLSASKVAAIVAFTSELIEDNIVDMGAYVNELLAEAFAQEEDEQMFAGTGSPYTGLFNTTSTYGNTVSVANSASIGYDDLVACSVGLKSWYLRGASWKMHRSVYGDLLKIKDNNGNPIITNPGDNRRELFGYPIQLIETAPDNTTTTSSMPLIILGNTNKNSFFGIKREMTMKVLTEATINSVNLAANDLIGLRVTKRDAFSVGLVGAYSVISIT